MLIAALIALAVACLTVAFPDWPAVVACEYRQLGRRRRERQRDEAMDRREENRMWGAEE